MKQIFLSHILEVLNQESFPVIGNSINALVFALLFTAAVLILYLVIDYLPQAKKKRITAKNEPTFIKAMIVLIVFAMVSAGWDVWWHRAIGRDNFWIMPHIMLYSFIAAAIILGFYVWRHSRDFVWKHISFLLLLIPVSGAFDNYFHTLWGLEGLSKPLYLSWSPAHILLNLAVMAILGLLLVTLSKYRRTHDFNFFGNLCFGSIFALILFLILPFYPTGPWGQIIGFSGAGVITLFYVFICLTAEKFMQGRIDATMTSIFILIFAVITYGKETAPHIRLLPHDRPPIWLFAFALIFTGILFDLTKDRFPNWVRGLFGGILFSTILFGFSTSFFAPQFQYGLVEIYTAVVFSAIGGLVAGSFFGLFHLDDEKHIKKHLQKWL